MSSKDDYPKSRNYSPAEIANGLLRKDREAWTERQREQGLPTTPPPNPKNYSYAEIMNGVLRRDREDYEKAKKK